VSVSEFPATIVVDLVTHSEVLIDASPATIWPSILDTNDWHKHQTVVPVGGPSGEAGERFHSTPHGQPDLVLLNIEAVEVEPRKRRTIRIDMPGFGFIGFATWTLVERNSGTAVAYDVYCRHPVPVEAWNDGLMGQMRQGMDEGLLNLKALIEGRAAA
jgi:uncharacterized protein YndB with AHSA1/START domain